MKLPASYESLCSTSNKKSSFCLFSGPNGTTRGNVVILAGKNKIEKNSIL